MKIAHPKLGALCCFCLVGQGNTFLIMLWHIFGETSMLDIGRRYIIAGMGSEVRELYLKEGKNMC